MKEVDLNYVFDLERVIKKTNKIYLSNKKNEEKLEAHYILDTFAKKVGINAETIKNAKIKTTEMIYTNTKELKKPRTKKRRVVKYFVISEKNKLEIIKQIMMIGLIVIVIVFFAIAICVNMCLKEIKTMDF